MTFGVGGSPLLACWGGGSKNSFRILLGGTIGGLLSISSVFSPSVVGALPFIIFCCCGLFGLDGGTDGGALSLVDALDAVPFDPENFTDFCCNVKTRDVTNFLFL